ncbi:MAG: glycosyltransferase family 4 protein, partial [Longimicrobiales bacterium]|nr:glycosyltransferase family 4 protein [Longimicrobiales bacterium]
RIGLVVPGGVDRSGTHRVIPYLVEFITALARRHDVRVIALRQEPAPGGWMLGDAEVRNIGARPRRLRALALLSREHRRRPFDVLHGFALVPQGALVALAGRLLGVPWVVEAPGGEFADLSDIGFGGWRRAPGRFWVRLASHGAAACAVPSEQAFRLTRSRGVDAIRIPLPLSPDAWPARPPRARTVQARLAWVGSLNRVKDPALLLDTALALRERGLDFHLDVVGEDLLGGVVHRRARTLGLDSLVTFHGFLTQGALRELLGHATLLLVTSRFDAGPRVVLEAASLGVPTVGTAVGYVDEWSPDGALADAVIAVLDDEERRQALGRNALVRLKEHDCETVVSKWEAVYRKAAGRGVDRD